MPCGHSAEIGIQLFLNHTLELSQRMALSLGSQTVLKAVPRSAEVFGINSDGAQDALTRGGPGKQWPRSWHGSCGVRVETEKELGRAVAKCSGSVPAAALSPQCYINPAPTWLTEIL